MTTEAVRIVRQENTLMQLGFTAEEVAALRQASATVHRWALREYSGEIERDADGTPWRVWNARRSAPVYDQEAGAIKRINEVLASRNARSPESALSWYCCRDPRRCAVYILRGGVHRGVKVC
jgi:hypothetical protein